MLGVYNYMASALALTGIFAYAGSHFAPLMNMLYKVSENGHFGLTGLGWVIAFAPLFMAMGLGMGVQRLSVPAAQALFWAFSAVMGLSLSSLFLIYTGQSLVRVFFITAIMFGSMGIWGYSTKRDLTSMGNFLIMGVWGIVIASLVNLFLQSSGLQFAISIIGVVAFTGLVAYDTQKIKQMYYAVGASGELAAKYSIMAALNLYMDFINLFIMLLRFFGERK